MLRQKLMLTPGRAAVGIGAALSLAVAGVAAQPLRAPSLAAGSGATRPPKYVSMGSSYAAGPGVGRLDGQSGRCRRSLSNYAHLLAARRNLNLVDVGCSGATTADILQGSQDGLRPQIDAVDADTRLVTVTVGGNDVNYVGNLVGYTCRHRGGATCEVVSDAKVDQRFQALPGSLRQIVAEVHRRAPKARLVMIGYLPVLPGSETLGCAAVPLSLADLRRMQAIYSRLTDVIGSVAQETGTPVVRSSVIGSGHDACSAQPFVTGFEPPVTPGWPSLVSYHPNQAGMNRLASALDETLKVLRNQNNKH
ncbi:MAG: SGNH/GDSL hydrolase family protein [Nostoc sp.]|uniref:SGNH/GDSL hydrolase family protein n=1 Tax=Nostoc sp. TaxID=1180 RepID=UPI002FF66100